MTTKRVRNLLTPSLGRVAQGFPDEGYGVRYTHPSRTAITAVTNTVYKLGVPALFPILLQLLAVRRLAIHNNDRV